jgi:ArsR family transcriptional regulator
MTSTRLELAAPCCALGAPPVSPADAEAIAPMFKALGDPVRLRLVSLIAAQPEACVCDLVGAFPLSGPTISHHLKVLRGAGLVDCERRGTWVYYWVRPEALARLSSLLGRPISPA